MKLAVLFLSLFIFTACSNADAGRLFENYLWQKRLLVIFTPDSNNTPFQEQITELATDPAGLKERDILIWQITANKSVKVGETYKAHLASAPFYREYGVSEKEFTVLLIGKDGEVKLQRDQPIQRDTLFETIDAMPMRQREMGKR